ncbi:MAG: hypothetical protein JHC93_01525 [Parachlamydiales bacterium]|nr:hypothetical protein [Parachlamydiales bacterium]
MSNRPLKAILLTSAPDRAKIISSGMVSTSGLNIPNESALNKKLESYLGKDMTEMQNSLIKAAIIQHYHQETGFYVDVSVSSQDLYQGTIIIKVDDNSIKAATMSTSTDTSVTSPTPIQSGVTPLNPTSQTPAPSQPGTTNTAPTTRLPDGSNPQYPSSYNSGINDNNPNNINLPGLSNPPSQPNSPNSSNLPGQTNLPGQNNLPNTPNTTYPTQMQEGSYGPTQPNQPNVSQPQSTIPKTSSQNDVNTQTPSGYETFNGYNGTNYTTPNNNVPNSLNMPGSPGISTYPTPVQNGNNLPIPAPQNPDIPNSDQPKIVSPPAMQNNSNAVDIPIGSDPMQNYGLPEGQMPSSPSNNAIPNVPVNNDTMPIDLSQNQMLPNQSQIPSQDQCINQPIDMYQDGMNQQAQDLSKECCPETPCCQEIIRGIVLTSSIEYVPDSTVGEFTVWEMKIPNQSNLKNILTPYVGKEISVENLSAIKQDIIKHYQTQKRPLVVVNIPAQEVICGIIVFHIFEGYVGCVSTCGNEWFSDDLIIDTINVQGECEFDQEDVLNSLAWFNRNPFHQSEIVLSPSDDGSSTNLQIVTRDRFPLRPYIGVDNTGTEVTGKTRFYVGFNWSSPYGVNDLFTYQYTFGESLHAFSAHYANYMVFLPNKNILTLAGGFAEVHADITDFSNEGRSAYGSAHYTMPFLPLYTLDNSEIAFGVDYKNINSNLLFIANQSVVPVIANTVNIFELYFSYKTNFIYYDHEFSLLVENIFSPGQIFPDQSRSDYQALRNGAEPDFDYARVNFSHKYTWYNESSIRSQLRGQVATGSLLPSEQFGLGGMYTVRGYEEREFNADNALCINVEWYAPPLQMKCRELSPKLSYLFFTDFGFGHNYNAANGIKANDYVWSVGPGLRFNLNPYITARCDYGIKLHKLNSYDDSFGMFNFSVTASY